MHDLLDCQILKDGVDYARGYNKVLKESLRYRFLFEHKDVDDYTVRYNINHLLNWYKWYNITYCKTIPLCPTTKTIYCGVDVIEIADIACIPDITITEIN